MIINLKVRPHSGRQEIKKISGSETPTKTQRVSDKNYLVYLKSSPENNKANIELIKLLRRYFDKDVRIINGKSSMRKTVEVKDEI